MKKQFASLLVLPLMIFSCSKSSTDMPSSPFNDTYKRIGMTGEYKVNLDSLDASEYATLKKKIDDYDYDKKVTRVVRQEETRDLKYAYFGKEVGSVSFCSMLSSVDIEERYTKSSSNYVTTKIVNSDLQNQTANGGIIKNKSITGDYIYDVSYFRGNPKVNMGIRTSVKNNNEDPVVTQSLPETATYESDNFNLTPYTKDIKEHFEPTTIRGEDYDFTILGDNNSAVYGKCTIDTKPHYLVKEGYSLFAPYTTVVGRTYKAEDNFFYEALLDEDYRFVSFRFYHELLILSKAYDEGVPVIYLEKPMTVEFSEIKYDISYEPLGDYEGRIPDITQ